MVWYIILRIYNGLSVTKIWCKYLVANPQILTKQKKKGFCNILEGNIFISKWMKQQKYFMLLCTTLKVSVFGVILVQMLENAEEKNSKYRHLSSSHGYSSLISWAYQNPWTLDASIGRWILDAGPWTLDAELWTLGNGRLTINWSLDSELWTLKL